LYSSIVSKTHSIGYTLAITNSSNTADAGVYYLPEIPLVSGSRPSCSHCTQQLFQIYDTFANNATLEISKNYYQAAQVVDLNCGVDFVSINHQTSTSIASQGFVVGRITLLIATCIGMALTLIF